MESLRTKKKTAIPLIQKKEGVGGKGTPAGKKGEAERSMGGNGESTQYP